MAIYPPKDSGSAHIVKVAPGSPADDAGFEPGCILTSVDGEPLRDVIDWRWLTSTDEIQVGYIDLDGDAGAVALWREPGEDWGFEFDGLVFDGVKQCRNACTFCFMRQLPEGMRPSLYVRDDDFRLSFLVGTFVTFTNLSEEDERRIVEQRISPLRVSLQASSPDVRERLIGRHARHGLDALDRLLASGIEFHAQVVLVPGENDGAELERTLEWAYARPGILNVGIVPLGFTRHQQDFMRSFNDPADARAVLDIIEAVQARAVAERGHAWVYAADEFYRNAYGRDVLAHLPDAAHYGDFSLFEDGIGIIRSVVDEWGKAEASGLVARAGEVARQAGAAMCLVAGYAQKEFLDKLVGDSGIGSWFRTLYVHNGFFGGNVDVTGLLTGGDIAAAIRQDRACKAAGSGSEGAWPSRVLYLVPRVVFNDDGLALDDLTLADMEKEAGVGLHMVSCSPLDYFEEIIALCEGAG